MYLGGGLEQFDSHQVSKLACILRNHNLKKGIISYVRFGCRFVKRRKSNFFVADAKILDISEILSAAL
jgi:hypothetical protein